MTTAPAASPPATPGEILDWVADNAGRFPDDVQDHLDTVQHLPPLLLPDQIAETTVTMSDGKVVEIGGPAVDEVIDARGLILAPALVDVHGDAFERQVMPRPGVYFPMETALLETDRQLAANGIATAYHAVTLGWEPGLRDVVLRYYPSSHLSRRRGTVPTPSGILGVAWEMTPAEFLISLQVPTNTTVRLDLASLRVTSPDHILLDGEPVSPQQMKGGFLPISPGECTVQIKRM